MIKKLIISISLILLIVVVALWYSIILPDDESNTSVTATQVAVERQTLFDTLLVRGMLEPLTSTIIMNEKGQEIQELHVTVGQEIENGDLLITYEDGEEVTSYISGRIEEIFTDEEEIEIMRIAAGNSNYWVINGYITEYEIDQLYRGNKAEVELIALPDKKFEGYLTKLDTNPNSEEIIHDTESSITSYPYEVIFDGENNSLYYGYHANVFFEIQTSNSTNVLPRDVVFSEEEDDVTLYYIYKEEDGVLFKEYLEVGISDDEYVEVKSTLEVDDHVLSFEEDSKLREGIEVIIHD